MKRLSAGGIVLPGVGEKKDGILVRRAIFVHEGIFGSLDGPVAVDSGRCQRVAANMNAHYAKMGHEYNGSIPLGAYIPLLDQHATDSNRRVNGRVTGDFKAEILDIPMVGKGLWAVTGNVAFIGDEAIAMAEDGRIYNLSICINETNETLGEVSSVIEPAAPGAMLLSKGKRSSEKQFKHAEHLIDTWFDEGDKKWYFEVGGHFSSAATEAEATQKAKAKADEMYAAQTKKRFSATPLVGDPKTEKNKNMPNALKKRLAAKRLHIESLKLLVGNTEDSKRLAADKKVEGVRLAAEAKVRSRLSGLMKGGKLTPAEFKKLDVKKLSAMAPEAQEAVLAQMDQREPVIVPGQQGSTDAVTISDIRAQAGDDNFKRLKAEAATDVYKKLGRKVPGSADPATKTDKRITAAIDDAVEKRLSAGAKLAAEPEAEKKLSDDRTKCMGDMEKCLEAGNLDDAKKHMGELKKLGLGGSYAGGDLVAEGLEKVLSEQQMAIDQLHVQLAKLNDALKLMLAAEEAEEQEMAADPAAAEGEAELGADGKPLPPKEGDKPAPGKEGEKNLEGKEGGDKAPPAKKEGEGDAPPPKKEEEKK